jgi:hypothetical protein
MDLVALQQLRSVDEVLPCVPEIVQELSRPLVVGHDEVDTPGPGPLPIDTTTGLRDGWTAITARRSFVRSPETVGVY